jgi:hypothetical protein
MIFGEPTYGTRPPTPATGTRIVESGPGPTSDVLSRLLGFLASSGLSIAAFLTQVARDRSLTARMIAAEVGFAFGLVRRWNSPH